MRLISIDPGSRSFAFACFHDDVLENVGFVEKKSQESLLQSLPDVAPHFEELDAVVIEKPYVYQQKFLKGDPNDLISVAITVGALADQAVSEKIKVEFALPRQWKGSVPKKIHGNRIWNKLNMVEQTLVSACGLPKSKLHNVIDAVGIGLWRINR